MVEANKWLDAETGESDCLLQPTAYRGGADAGRLFRRNINRQFFDDHLWISVAVRNTPSSFTRVQRLSCCLSILFLTMISNAMWYKTEDKKGTPEMAQMGPFSVTVHDIYTSVLASFSILPAVLLITLFFTMSAEKESEEDREKYMEYSETDTRQLTAFQRLRQRKELPHWMVYIGWLLVVLSVLVSGSFTIFYALDWGGQRSTAWLRAFLLSFFESVIIIQPLKVNLTRLSFLFLL
jgi:4-amino-4-deoxy-L-arabinose transferase-like glycosyltransferase